MGGYRGFFRGCSRAVVVGAVLAGHGAHRAAAAPSVSSVSASQRQDGSGLVDIRYDVSGGAGAMTVTVIVSADNGVTWGVTPAAAHLSGDVGPGVTNGMNRRIVWNAAADRPEVLWPQCRVKVTATDGGVGPQERTISLPGGVPLVLVRVPSGSFQMGSPATERSRWSGEGPVHTVTIGYAFYMGKYEATQAQWVAVMGSNPSYFSGDTSRPVEQVSWNDVKSFITALNAHIAATGQGPLTVRLPSDAEWEYACRAGTQTRFSFGDSLGVGDDCEDDGVRSQYMWYCGNAAGQTHPVGTKLPNAFGLYDMHGNVWEWCEDWWHGDYSGAPTDGSAWVVPTASDRVIRGGYWGNLAQSCRSAGRGNLAPSSRLSYFGFRLAAVQ